MLSQRHIYLITLLLAFAIANNVVAGVSFDNKKVTGPRTRVCSKMQG